MIILNSVDQKIVWNKIPAMVVVCNNVFWNNAHHQLDLKIIAISVYLHTALEFDKHYYIAIQNLFMQRLPVICV